MNAPFPTSSRSSVICTLTTSPAAGAVAIIQLAGHGTQALLRNLTGRPNLPVGRAVLADMAGIDHGLAILWNEDWAQLMPHGGPRVVQRLLARLMELGAAVPPDTQDTTPVNRQLYPEAGSELEADMLATLATAGSPAAVDRLLAQPDAWQQVLPRLENMRDDEIHAILERGRVLGRLLQPARVVVAGQPNVGKSTLTNAMLGRAASIVADMPGTTRDWVAGVTQIAGVAIAWMDTPGLRTSDDLIEQHAITLSSQVIQQADVLLVMRDPQTPWPTISDLGRTPDLWVMNKSDTLTTPTSPADTAGHAGISPDEPMLISARDHKGLELLGQRILRHLGLADIQHLPLDTPWAFKEVLVNGLQNRNVAMLDRYIDSMR